MLMGTVGGAPNIYMLQMRTAFAICYIFSLGGATINAALRLQSFRLQSLTHIYIYVYVNWKAI